MRMTALFKLRHQREMQFREQKELGIPSQKRMFILRPTEIEASIAKLQQAKALAAKLEAWGLELQKVTDPAEREDIESVMAESEERLAILVDKAVDDLA